MPSLSAVAPPFTAATLIRAHTRLQKHRAWDGAWQLSEKHYPDLTSTYPSAASPYAHCLRDGRTVAVPHNLLVKGDIVFLAGGDRSPARLEQSVAAPLFGEWLPDERKQGASGSACGLPAPSGSLTRAAAGASPRLWKATSLRVFFPGKPGQYRLQPPDTATHSDSQCRPTPARSPSGSTFPRPTPATAAGAPHRRGLLAVPLQRGV